MIEEKRLAKLVDQKHTEMAMKDETIKRPHYDNHHDTQELPELEQNKVEHID